MTARTAIVRKSPIAGGPNALNFAPSSGSPTPASGVDSRLLATTLATGDAGRGYATRTVKLPVVRALSESVALTLTVVSPRPKRLPLGGVTVGISGPSSASFAVTEYVTAMPPGRFGTASTGEAGSVSVGRALPVPVRLMSNGFSSLSSFAMWSAAVFAPLLVGAKRTVNVVLPPEPITVAAGCDVTLNMTASAPSTATLGVPESVTFPLLAVLTVKTSDDELPVFTSGKARLPPSAMSLPAGCSRVISGVPALTLI